MWGGQGAKCPKCRTPSLRKAWGCDAPAEDPVYSRTCTACRGNGTDCQECQGRGQVMRYRCPQSETDVLGMTVVRALSQWQNGVLPGPGGWGDQCSRLAELVDVAAAEKHRIDEQAQQAAKKGNGGGKGKGR